MQILKHHVLNRIVAPLMMGVLLYWLFRGIPYFSIAPVFQKTYYNPFISFLVFNIPDGLWLYALLSSLRIIWNNHLSMREQHWICVAIILTITTELLQLYLIIPGTYDPLDIGVYIIASLIFFLSKQHNNQITKHIFL